MDESLDWTGVLMNLYGRLPIVHRLWYAHVTGRSLPVHSVPDAGGADSVPAILDADADFGALPHVDGIDEGVPVGVDAPGPDSSAAPASGTELDPNSSEQKQKDRTVALAYISVPSLPATSIAIRKLCTPLFNLMHSLACAASFFQMQPETCQGVF